MSSVRISPKVLLNAKKTENGQSCGRFWKPTCPSGKNQRRIVLVSVDFDVHQNQSENVCTWRICDCLDKEALMVRLCNVTWSRLHMVDMDNVVLVKGEGVLNESVIMPR